MIADRVVASVPGYPIQMASSRCPRPHGPMEKREARALEPHDAFMGYKNRCSVQEKVAPAGRALLDSQPEQIASVATN